MEDEKVESLEEVKEVKTKRPRSQKQIEQFEKAKATRDANRKARAEQKAIEEANRQKELEDKIVKKAIAIKKKQILQQKVLDDVSDDDTPIEKVKAVLLEKELTEKPVTISRHQIKEPTASGIANNPRFFFI